MNIKECGALYVDVYLEIAVRVALHIWEICHGFPAKGLFLLEAVRAPEGAVHLGPRCFEALCQINSLAIARLCHPGLLHATDFMSSTIHASLPKSSCLKRCTNFLADVAQGWQLPFASAATYSVQASLLHLGGLGVLMHGSVQRKALMMQCLQNYTTLLGSVLHLHGGTGLRQVSSSGVQEAHIVRQLKAGLRLRGLNIAPGQAKRQNGGRHNATAWRCSLCNFPAVRAVPRLGYLTGTSLAVV